LSVKAASQVDIKHSTCDVSCDTMQLQCVKRALNVEWGDEQLRTFYQPKHR